MATLSPSGPARPWLFISWSHRPRLPISIIDLSGGHQPRPTKTGAFTSSLTGIYITRASPILVGHAFSRPKLTPNYVHLYEQLGEACVEKLPECSLSPFDVAANHSSRPDRRRISPCITRNRELVVVCFRDQTILRSEMRRKSGLR